MSHSTPGFLHRELTIDGLTTGFLEAGDGPPLILLHGGEFGSSAELAWERVIEPLARDYRVIAPDFLGYGRSAKIIDFTEGRARPIRHLASLLRTLGITKADFVGNSFGGVNLIFDQTSAAPVLPVRRMALVCGGGEILQNQHTTALYDYDASIEGMRRIVAALFHDPAYASDEAYVARRWESSTLPGAWEAVAAARFRRPGHVSGASPAQDLGVITAPTLVVEGQFDKLKPAGWATGIAAQIPGARSIVIDGAGHCPQIEQPDAFVAELRAFLADDSS